MRVCHRITTNVNYIKHTLKSISSVNRIIVAAVHFFPYGDTLSFRLLGSSSLFSPLFLLTIA